MTDELTKIYYRKYGVTMFKIGLYDIASQIFIKNYNQRGDLKSSIYVGWMLLFGYGGDKRPKLSVKIFHQAMKKGSLEAEKLLAYVFLNTDAVNFPDRKWAGWTLGSGGIIDLFNEESF